MADSTIAASIAAGISQVIAYTGTANNATFNGNQYTVGRGVLSLEQQYAIMGEIDGYDETLTFLTSELTANGDTPEEGDEVTIDGSVKRILRITRDDSFGTTTRLHCGGRFA